MHPFGSALPFTNPIGNAQSSKLKHDALAGGYHPEFSERGDHLSAACLEEGRWILRDAKLFEDCKNGLNSQVFFCLVPSFLLSLFSCTVVFGVIKV